jgi:hypothetical protein
VRIKLFWDAVAFAFDLGRWHFYIRLTMRRWRQCLVLTDHLYDHRATWIEAGPLHVEIMDLCKPVYDSCLVTPTIEAYEAEHGAPMSDEEKWWMYRINAQSVPKGYWK